MLNLYFSHWSVCFYIILYIKIISSLEELPNYENIHKLKINIIIACFTKVLPGETVLMQTCKCYKVLKF